MVAPCRARDALFYSLLLSAGACAGGGGLRLADITPETVPSLEAERSQRPQDPVVLSRLGVAYFRANRYQDARTAFDTALARDPQNGIAAVYLGMTTEALGDFTAARAAYERYIAVARSRELRGAAQQRLRLVGKRELEYQARQALAQEATLSQQAPEANTIAVMPFSYSGSNREIMPLTRGLAQLVVTDLAKSRQVRVLERERMQAILDEMRLSEEGRADPQAAVRGGRLLRAARVVQGALADRDGQLRVDAAVVDVSTAGVAASAGDQAALDQLFDLEKRVVFSIFENLGIQLTDAERQAINQRPTQSIQAFLAYSQGLEAEDRGDFAAAQAAFSQATQLDPAFQAAAASAGAAGELSQAAGQSVTEVEATVVTQNAQQEAPPAAPTESQQAALQNGANAAAPTQTSQAAQEQGQGTRGGQSGPSQPPPTRDTTAEATTGDRPRPATGTVVIIIRRPT
jgi:TolB-like protein/cytochrome c-type biogenesis protein CcmH/NrfG